MVFVSNHSLFFDDLFQSFFFFLSSRRHVSLLSDVLPRKQGGVPDTRDIRVPCVLVICTCKQGGWVGISLSRKQLRSVTRSSTSDIYTVSNTLKIYL